MRLRRFIKNLPRRGPVQQSDRDIRNDLRIVDVAEIHGAHIRTIRALVRSFIVRNTAAGGATIELESLLSPRVHLECLRLGQDLDRPPLKVRPEGPVASTHGAVALRHFSRLSLQLQLDRTTVT